MKKNILLLTILMLMFSCAQKAFVKGDYEDPEKQNLLNDQWSETDMQVVVKNLTASMLAHPAIANAKTPPIVMFTKLQNKTSDHIDMQSIVDMMTVELSQSGKIAFVNKQAREDVAEEYNYQNSGMVSEETKKTAGGQIGADYIVDGRLDSITQTVDKEKTVYYKLTLNLTNLKTNIIVWTNHKEIRKKFKKKTIGL
ncbi:MAG: penicillin-binding protein activator LpoB [Pseudobdellovibrio sp.]